MITLAIALQKGGVGKTTTAVNLAYALAQREFRVALVDFDPQGNATTASGVVSDGERLAETLVDGDALPWQPTEWGYDLAAGGSELGGIKSALEELRHPTPTTSLKESLHGAPYDVVVVDTAPGFEFHLLAALMAATHVLCPVQPTRFALDGLTEFLGTLRSITRGNRGMELAGVLLTSIDGRSDATNEDAREAVDLAAPGLRLEAEIHHAKVLKDAQEVGEPVGAYDASTRAAKEYQQVADELWRRIHDEA